MRFGQRVGAQLLQRVLRGDHEKGRRQRARLAFHAHLLFFHRFQQRALRFGAGAVDFVGQQNLRKHGARVKSEALARAVIHRHAGKIAGHQIGRELHARERQPEGARQRLRQRGFAHAGHVFNQQMAARQQAHHAALHLRGLASDHAIELAQHGLDFFGDLRRNGSCSRHAHEVSGLSNKISRKTQKK